MLFLGSSLDDLRTFPAEARREAGFELDAIQRGLEPRDWKPFSSVGSGVREIRIHVLGEWRVIYVASLGDSVYVLHCFQKKSQNDEARCRTRAPALQINRWSQMSRRVTKSSGNVFLDLGFPPEEAAVLKLRSDLMGDLREFIEKNRLTQSQAAGLLGITQSRVSDLVRGKWEKFSLEMLITLVARTGRKVELRFAA